MDVNMEQLDRRVHRSKALYRERRTAALRCGCGRLCARCRSSIEATFKSLQRALSELDGALDLMEQRQISAPPVRRSA